MVALPAFPARAARVLALDAGTLGAIALADRPARRQATLVVLVSGFIGGLGSNGQTMLRVLTRDGAAVDPGFLASGMLFWAIGVVLVLGLWSILARLTRVVAVRGFAVPPSPGLGGRLDATVAWAFLPSRFGVLGFLPVVGTWIAVALWVWASAVFVAAVQAALGASIPRAVAVAATVAGIVAAAVLGPVFLLAVLA